MDSSSDVDLNPMHFLCIYVLHTVFPFYRGNEKNIFRRNSLLSLIWYSAFLFFVFFLFLFAQCSPLQWNWFCKWKENPVAFFSQYYGSQFHCSLQQPANSIYLFLRFLSSLFWFGFQFHFFLSFSLIYTFCLINAE